VPALLALLASLLWGAADFLGGTATRRLPLASVVGVSQLVALIALLPLAVAVGALGEPRDYLVPALAAGVAGLVAVGSFYRALALGTMGVVAPVAALGVVVPVAAGLIRGESPSPLQLGGIVVAVVGVVMASGPELTSRGGALPLVLAAVAALGFGAVFVLIAEATSSGSFGSVVMTLIIMRLVIVVLLPALLLLTARSRGRGIGVRRGDLPVLLAIGAFDVGANAAYALAAQSDLISVTAVLASLYPVVTVLMARQIHRERLAGLQLPGVVLALTGVVLLAGG
jgi:drug/metabolite transporter (DMT)-like permease